MALPIPFASGQLVVLALRDPKERVWGRLLGLEASGIAVRGVELTPWEEILSLVKRGEADQVALATRFVPMHRVESLYLDEPSSGVESLAEEFRRRAHAEPADFLADLA
ncbi:MAG TPA: hypothetical protein VN436_06100 [Holophaga sp.]|nr:hypothetical protein [Holophaga sp.]